MPHRGLYGVNARVVSETNIVAAASAASAATAATAATAASGAANNAAHGATSSAASSPVSSAAFSHGRVGYASAQNGKARLANPPK